MLKLIPFEAMHAQVLVHGLMNNNILKLAEKHRHLLNDLEVKNKSFTAITDEGIVCSGGIVPVWEGVYEGWVMGSQLINKYKLSSARLIKWGLDKVIIENKMNRLQTAVLKDYAVGHQFAKWLGLENEGLMKQYGVDKKDYYRYARIF